MAGWCRRRPARDRTAIMLCEGDQGHAGTWLWIATSDVDALYAELEARGARLRHAPANYPWGSTRVPDHGSGRSRVALWCGPAGWGAHGGLARWIRTTVAAGARWGLAFCGVTIRVGSDTPALGGLGIAATSGRLHRRATIGSVIWTNGTPTRPPPISGGTAFRSTKRRRCSSIRWLSRSTIQTTQSKSVGSSHWERRPSTVFCSLPMLIAVRTVFAS